MTTKGKWAMLTALGVLLAAAGVIVGFVTMSAGGVSCGSAFSPAQFDQGVTLGSMFDANVNTSMCAPVTAGAAWAAWLLIIGGLAALIFGVPGAAGFDWPHAFAPAVDASRIAEQDAEQGSDDGQTPSSTPTADA